MEAMRLGRLNTFAFKGTDSEIPKPTSEETTPKVRIKDSDPVFLYHADDFLPDINDQLFTEILKSIPAGKLPEFRKKISNLQKFLIPWIKVESFQPIAMMHYCLKWDESSLDSISAETTATYKHISRDLNENEKELLLNAFDSVINKGAPEQFPYGAYKEDFIIYDTCSYDGPTLEFHENFYNKSFQKNEKQNDFLKLLTDLVCSQNSNKEKISQLQRICNNADFNEAYQRLNDQSMTDFSKKNKSPTLMHEIKP